MKRLCWLGMALVILVGAAGCGGELQDEQIKVRTEDPLTNAKSLLQRYADGQWPGSEVTTFAYMVEEVRKVDPAKAEVLKKGFDEIQASPQEAAAKARELLGKL